MKHILKWLLSVVIAAAFILAGYLLYLAARYYSQETIGVISFLFVIYLIWAAKQIVNEYL
ncbi:hypothetical protein PDL71_15345 [Lacibacter sp. MH-610]|uniref:hypothetical protein n=1 Tax=Lacibacter sp. MH-610 TaxID=3020883 RepID=UPI0038923849